MAKKIQKIGIDCRLSGNAHAGIGRYTEELITRLPKLDKNMEWVLFFYSRKQADDYLAKIPQPTDHIKIVIAPVKHYSLAEQLKLPKIFGKEKLDLLHVPHFNIPIFYRRKIIITIHDLLWHEFKGLNITTLNPIKYLFKYFAYKFVAGRALKKARRIIVPANTTGKTVLKYYPRVKEKIIIIKEGASPKFKLRKSDANSKHNQALIYIGSLYPHKNIKVVLEALGDLPQYTLKLVGSRDIFTTQTKKLVEKFGVSQQVEFLGFLSDEKLNTLLQKSFALIQPSLSEGFGLTGLEAMAAGSPVLASNIPIFNEIYKKGAIYFDSQEAESLIRAIQKLEKSNREKIIKNGLKVSKLYNWDRMARETLIAYES